MVEPMIGAIGPSFASACSGSSGSSSTPSASPSSNRNARTVSVITIGNRCRPTRATASAIAVTALSSWIMEPWPGRPRACSRSQVSPFSAVSIR
jgi:hypothetical protein